MIIFSAINTEMSICNLVNYDKTRDLIHNKTDSLRLFGTEIHNKVSNRPYSLYNGVISKERADPSPNVQR